jgi:hypothetical protein
MAAASIFVLSMNCSYNSTKMDSADEKLCTELFTATRYSCGNTVHFS